MLSYTRSSGARTSRRGVLRRSDEQHRTNLTARRHRVRPRRDERRRRVRRRHGTIHGASQRHVSVQRHHRRAGQTESTSSYCQPKHHCLNSLNFVVQRLLLRSKTDAAKMIRHSRTIVTVFYGVSKFDMCKPSKGVFSGKIANNNVQKSACTDSAHCTMINMQA